MPGEVNCLFTKILVPFVEQEAGEKGVAAILQAAGHTREYLTADHNWIPLTMADGLARLAMDMSGETDEERWGRRFGDFSMDWKPTHEERSYIGTYTMGMGSPRAVYQRVERISAQCHRSHRMRLVEMARARATIRLEV